MISLLAKLFLPKGEAPSSPRLRTAYCTLCSGKKLAFRYELFREGEDKPCSTAKSFHIWVKDGKSVNIEADYPEMFSHYAPAVEE